MSQQWAVTVRATIRPGRQQAVAELLDEMGRKGADNELLPFRELDGLHFARLFVVQEATGRSGDRPPASLVYMSDVDGPATGHLVDLVRRAAPGMDALFGNCLGYPEPGSGGPARVRWLRDRLVAGATTYVHAAGRGVRQVREEQRLRAEIEDFLDRPDAVPAGATAAEVHRLVRGMVGGRPDLRWALRPAPGPGLPRRVRDAVHRVAVPAALVLLAPLAVPAAVVLVLAVRRQELRDRRNWTDPGPPAPQRLRELERYEDFAAQNPFTGVGAIKPGVVRRLALAAALGGLGYATRHCYAHDNLAGVRTIHFARWLPIDGGERLIFASSYDGSLESYMDDFVDRLAWGLNLVFSNGVGYPPTRWLLFGGARDEQAFKRFLRRHQLPTPVFYSAYDALTARNIDANARLRAGLARPLAGAAADEWLALL